MSENEVASLTRKLDDINDIVIAISERLKDLPEMKVTVSDHDKKLIAMDYENRQFRQHCKDVQLSKEEFNKRTAINWGNVKTTIIGTVISGLLMLLLGLYLGNVF